MNELALFAGVGGGLLASQLIGFRTVCAVELDEYRRCVLVQRQNDGHLRPPFPIWDDIRTFDGRPWRGIVDVVSGGFPCQDISIAGRGDGLEGERSSMWREMARVVGEVRPAYVYVENSPMLTTRGGNRVIADLTALGYDAQWDVMGAADVGAPHQRDRIWIVAYSNEFRIQSKQELSTWKAKRIDSGCNEMAYTNSAQCQRNGRSERAFAQHANTCRTSWWDIEPNVGRVADGVAARVDRLKAIGNGQVPAVAATAWKLLIEEMQ